MIALVVWPNSLDHLSSNDTSSNTWREYKPLCRFEVLSPCLMELTRDKGKNGQFVILLFSAVYNCYASESICSEAEDMNKTITRNILITSTIRDVARYWWSLGYRRQRWDLLTSYIKKWQELEHERGNWWSRVMECIAKDDLLAPLLNRDAEKLFFEPELVWEIGSCVDRKEKIECEAVGRRLYR